MSYWWHLALAQMGFWMTWALIPVIVEILPALVSAAQLMWRNRHRRELTPPQKWPMITIIVPVYNSEETLFACIESLNKQTYPKECMQIILANNQSTDRSFEVFAHAQDHFRELILRYVNTDKGKAKAMNTAIYQSIGTYVVNIDSDGTLEPHAIEQMILRFENDPDIDAMTGAVLLRDDLIEGLKNRWHRVLARNEYFEYAQAFISGRTIESERDQLFTMSGAFSAFRRETLMETFLYDTDTIGEDTDMTFQIRTHLGKKVIICSNAIFYIEPISGLGELYTQRQRWQRGELEVTGRYMRDTASLTNFFSNFLVRRMMIDHTFIFPKMIWMFAGIVLVKFGYPLRLMLLSYVFIYALYVFVSWINYVSVLALLYLFPDEKRYFRKQWWVAFTLPGYNFICGWIRLVGTINGMTTAASWRLQGFSAEMTRLEAVLRGDWRALWHAIRGQEETHHDD